MPLILEHCLSLNVATFRHDLARNIAWRNSVHWTVRDKETASISYCFYPCADQPLLMLRYSIDGQDVTQHIQLEAVPSNLNRGRYWFFICPVSGRRCKKLHLIRGLFQHRTALSGVFYQQQARTPTAFGRYMDAYDVVGEIWEAAQAPYFREYYAGKPTRRCVRMLRKLEKWGPRTSEAEGERILRGGR